MLVILGEGVDIKIGNLRNSLFIGYYIILHIISFQMKRVSLLLEDFLVLISQSVRPFAFLNDNDAGALPVGIKLPLILLSGSLNHVLQDKVSDLKFVDLHLVVCGPDLLLVCCDTDLGLLPLFLLTDPGLGRVTHYSFPD